MTNPKDMVEVTEAERIAAGLTEAQCKIGAQGDTGLTTFGWVANWFSVLFLHKKEPGIFTGVIQDDGTVEHWQPVKLTPLGLEVHRILEQDRSPPHTEARIGARR